MVYALGFDLSAESSPLRFAEQTFSIDGENQTRIAFHWSFRQGGSSEVVLQRSVDLAVWSDLRPGIELIELTNQSLNGKTSVSYRLKDAHPDPVKFYRLKTESDS